MTLIYNYDDEGNYINSQVALVDEFGKEILPENSTYLEPLEEKESYKVKFNGKAWIYEEIPQTPEPTLDDLKEAKRAERDNMINSCIWRVQRYEQQTKLGLETTDTEEDYLELLNYIQFLRDLPESPDFPNIEVLTFDDWQYAKQQAVN